MSDQDDGAARFAALLTMLPAVDPRDDIDTNSLVRRFGHLAPVAVADCDIDAPQGSVLARHYTSPECHGGAGLVWVHGGAFVSGSLDMPESNWVAMELAARGVSVLALDYRKALGGVTHPLPSDDVYAGWAAASDLLGILGDRLHLGGASAGATLSAGVVHRLLADTAPLPASLVLVYPVVHSVVPLPGAETAAAMRRVPTALRFSPAFMRSVNLNYVGRPDRLTDPAAFPAHGELSGFPPTLVINAEADDLRPSGEAFVDALELAGVSVDGAVESGTVHGYLDVPGIAASIASIDRIAARILELDRD